MASCTTISATAAPKTQCGLDRCAPTCRITVADCTCRYGDPVRTLVTGAAGFIGSTLADRLLADGHSVVGVDDLSSGNSLNIVGAERHGGYEFAKADIVDADLIALI